MPSKRSGAKTVVPEKSVVQEQSQTGGTSDLPAQNDTANGPTNPTKTTKRTFTVLSVTRNDNEQEFKGGKFQSNTPAGAARKAANQACKSLYQKEDDNITIDIVIKEITKNKAGRSNQNKEYAYRATRSLNTKDVGFKGNAGTSVKIPFNFSMDLKSLKKDVAGNVTAEKTVTEADNETVTDATV